MVNNVSEISGKILALRFYMESTDFVYNYTGKISKAIVLTEAPELEYLFKPVKGFFKLLRISPPIEGERAVVPVYKTSNSGLVLKPIMLRGDYLIEVGIASDAVDMLYKKLRQAEGVKTRIKFENSVITYILNSVSIHEPRIIINGATFTIRTISPVLLPNPLTPTQHVRRFTTSPGVLLWVPHMIFKGALSHSHVNAEKALVELEACLSEHYSTWHKVVFINFDGNREPVLTARAKYIMIRKDEDYRKCKETLEKTLTIARIFGIGSSRANGFGSITIKTKTGG